MAAIANVTTESEVGPDEALVELEAEERRLAIIQHPPVVQMCLENCEKIHIKCHYTKEIFATVLAYDKHLNMLLKDVIVKRSATHSVAVLVNPTLTLQKKRSFKKFKFYKCIFLRGDNVIYVRHLKKEIYREKIAEVPANVRNSVNRLLREQIFGQSS